MNLWPFKMKAVSPQPFVVSGETTKDFKLGDVVDFIRDNQSLLYLETRDIVGDLIDGTPYEQWPEAVKAISRLRHYWLEWYGVASNVGFTVDPQDKFINVYRALLSLDYLIDDIMPVCISFDVHQAQQAKSGGLCRPLLDIRKKVRTHIKDMKDVRWERYKVNPDEPKLPVLVEILPPKNYFTQQEQRFYYMPPELVG